MPNRLLEISGEITPERMKKVVQETKCSHSILLDIVCYLNNVYIVIIKTVTMLPTLSSLASKRVLLPGVIRTNGMIPGLIQKQRKALFFPKRTGGGSAGKESANQCRRDKGPSLGWKRSPGEGNGNWLQYSCLENSMDRGAWWATVLGVAKSRRH